MLTWLAENIGTIAVLIVLIAIVTGIVLAMRKDKKSGKHSCGGNCSSCGGCAHAASCSVSQKKGNLR